jgi:hypothetical protein
MANGNGRQIEVVSQELQMTLMFFAIVMNPAKRVGILFARRRRG